MVGETLDWGVETLLGSVGAHILAVFLFIAGVLLVTGASVAGVIKFTSDSVSSTTRELRGAVKTARAEAPAAAGRRPGDARALHARAREGDAAEPVAIEEPPEFDVLWDEEPEPEATEPELGARGRAGARRAGRGPGGGRAGRHARAGRAGRRRSS